MTITARALHALLLLFALCTGPAWASIDAQSNSKKVADVLYEEALVLVDTGENQRAIDMMRKVVELEPDHAGAWLDLAMLNCRVGNAAATEELLTLVENRFKPNPQIRLVISSIQRTDCAGYAKLNENLRIGQNGLLRAELGVGTDDNVNQGLNNSSFLFNQGGNLIELQVAPSFRPRSDEFVQADFSYQKQGLNAFLQLRENFTEHEFDVMSGFVGYQTRPMVPNMNLQLGSLAGVLTLGGSLYQTTYQLNAQVSPTAFQSDHYGLRLMTAASQVSYPSLTGADAQLLEFAVENIWDRSSHVVATRVDYTFDQASSNRAGGDRRTQGLSLEFIKPLDELLQLRLGASHRRTQGEEAFAPGFFDDRRAQTRTTYSLGLSRALSNTSQLRLQVRKALNRENIDLFEYDNTVIRLSVLWDIH